MLFDRLVESILQENALTNNAIAKRIIVHYTVQGEHDANIYRAKTFTILKTKYKPFLDYLKSLQRKGVYNDFRSEGQPKSDGFSVYSGISDDGYIYSFCFVPEQNWARVSKEFSNVFSHDHSSNVNHDKHGWGDGHEPTLLPIIDEDKLENEESSEWDPHPYKDSYSS